MKYILLLILTSNSGNISIQQIGTGSPNFETCNSLGWDLVPSITRTNDDIKGVKYECIKVKGL